MSDSPLKIKKTQQNQYVLRTEPFLYSYAPQAPVCAALRCSWLCKDGVSRTPKLACEIENSGTLNLCELLIYHDMLCY